VNAHSMNPVRVLKMAQAQGGQVGDLYLVGCEPATIDSEEFGLSPRVQAAVPVAIDLIKSFVEALRDGRAQDFIKNTLGVEAR